MDRITLEQLLQYYDKTEDPADRLQIVTRGKDWDCADEFSIDSKLLEHFAKFKVTDMGCVESHKDKKPIIRVGIDYP